MRTDRDEEGKGCRDTVGWIGVRGFGRVRARVRGPGAWW